MKLKVQNPKIEETIIEKINTNQKNDLAMKALKATGNTDIEIIVNKKDTEIAVMKKSTEIISHTDREDETQVVK